MVIIVVGLLSFSLRGKHVLMLLLSLEYTHIGIFILMLVGLWVDMVYYPIIFLIFIVCEGVIGLSVVISISRRHGIGGLVGTQWGYV